MTGAPGGGSFFLLRCPARPAIAISAGLTVGEAGGHGGLQRWREQSVPISLGARAISAGASGATRFMCAIQKSLPAMTPKSAKCRWRRSAVCSLPSSTEQPDFRILWNSSRDRRLLYQESFSSACSAEAMGRFARSVQESGSHPSGGAFSATRMTQQATRKAFLERVIGSGGRRSTLVKVRSRMALRFCVGTSASTCA
jgi:hypothetical protein